MTYAPGIEEFVDRCNAVMPADFFTYAMEDQRRLYQSLVVEFPYALPLDVHWSQHNVTEGDAHPGFRLYEPSQPMTEGLVIYIRGGGFVMGSLDTHHSVAAEIASKSRIKVMAVDFRLAPEYPFPFALEDCYNALLYAHAQADTLGIDRNKIILAGDSSGANMAVVVAMMTRDRNGPALAGQALISPVLDFTRWRNGGDDAPLLTGGEMEFYTACYTPDPSTTSHPYVSPLVAGDFSGLPKAYVMGAEKDSLAIDAQLYAQALQRQGIDVELVIEPGMVHAAIRARALSPTVQDAWTRYCGKISEMARAVS
ncbi:alpha/beta hydrolase [Pseudomonas sp. ICMP 460]|uniref:alpha/beta hydrolase n=1 Tax=Pseudomonas sp. ICMP 460 TaxID=1718917 RepID=UPI000C0884C6|nr:alpha/beta hydrolase [Pseudomonas sp. ICMP 460]PHN30462.1 alpha/beta hydrolase [Pseudomonas sp. ICMP 460]